MPSNARSQAGLGCGVRVDERPGGSCLDFLAGDFWVGEDPEALAADSLEDCGGSLRGWHLRGIRGCGGWPGLRRPWPGACLGDVGRAVALGVCGCWPVLVRAEDGDADRAAGCCQLVVGAFGQAGDGVLAGGVGTEHGVPGQRGDRGGVDNVEGAASVDTPHRLTSRVQRHRSGGVPSTVPAVAIPVLLHTSWTAPNADRAWSRRASTSAARDTPAVTPVMLAPAGQGCSRPVRG
jgi:hypothetical protein